MKQKADIKEKILLSALELAGREGWHDALLPRAAKRAGLEEAYGFIAFPGGVGQLADYYTEHCNRRMVGALEKKVDKLKVRERIEEGVMARIAVYSEHKQAVRKLTAFYSLPTNSLRAMKNLATTADAIWRLAGDTSTDFNYYTKRLLLSGVYSTTVLYWLADESNDLGPTRAFLKRRLENVMAIQKVKGAVSGVAEKAGAMVEAFLPKAPAGFTYGAARPSGRKPARPPAAGK